MIIIIIIIITIIIIIITNFYNVRSSEPQNIKAGDMLCSFDQWPISQWAFLHTEYLYLVEGGLLEH